MFNMNLMEKFKNWMSESANILFDDSKNDLRHCQNQLDYKSYWF